ncbi:AbrB/MazE/SpoVT family DNA-binding domain-containing protein [Salmonella enterica subsp. enterica]|nr:AbrB/MazE/SpoVT family DNA-binding domain-containing protein [Salmonella enterica subsp. enterica serovar Enteritidis]
MNARAKISSKGQLVVPKAIRDAHGWDAGTEVEFVASGDEVILKTVRNQDPRFPPTDWEDFRKLRIKYDGPPVSIEEMDLAVLEEAKRRWHAKSR